MGCAELGFCGGPWFPENNSARLWLNKFSSCYRDISFPFWINLYPWYSGAGSSISNPEPRSTPQTWTQLGSDTSNLAGLLGSELKC